MFSFGEVIGTLGTAIKLVGSVYNAIKVGLDRNARSYYGKILEAIRTLYFFEDGTMGLLRKIAAKEDVDPLDFERASLRFFKVGDDVYRAIDRLVEYDQQGRAGLSIRDANDLKRIIAMKQGARIEVEEFIMELSHDYPNGSPAIKERSSRHAQQVIALIDELNAAIERVDESLRSHTR
jgi:hypothetical protein